MAVAIQTDARQVVRDALRSEPDRAGAVDRLVKLASRDGALFDALVERYRPTMLREVCQAAVRAEAGEERARARRLVAGSPERDIDELVSRARSIATVMESWTLPTGQKLQAATREQVLDAAEYHRRQAMAHRARAIFYQRLAARLKPGQVVGEELTEEEVQQMLAESEGAA